MLNPMSLWSLCTSLTGFIDEVSPKLEEQITAAKAQGLTGIEIRSVWEKNVTTLTPDELKQVRTQAAEAGIAIAGVGSPVNKVDAKPENFQGEMDKLSRAIEAAHHLGTKRIRIFSPVVNNEGRPEDFPIVRDWLAPMVELSKQEGITLLHENDSRFYGAFPAAAKMILEEFGGPQFKHVFDFSNSVMIGLDPIDDWFGWLIPHLESVHIKDFRLADQKIVPAGQGDARMLEAFRVLAKHNWSGVIALEPHLAYAGGQGGFSGADLFGQAVDALKTLLDQESTS